MPELSATEQYVFIKIYEQRCLVLQQGRACSFVIRISFFPNASRVRRLISADGQSCFVSVPRSPSISKMIIILSFPFLFLQDRMRFKTKESQTKGSIAKPIYKVYMSYVVVYIERY